VLKLLWIKGGPTGVETVPLWCSITSWLMHFISDHGLVLRSQARAWICAVAVAVRVVLYDLFVYRLGGGCLVVLCLTLGILEYTKLLYVTE